MHGCVNFCCFVFAFVIEKFGAISMFAFNNMFPYVFLYVQNVGFYALNFKEDEE
jgi:hypothetical protein